MPRPRARHRFVYLLAALAARRAWANTDNFTGNSSLWSDPNAWDTGVVPATGDDVNIFTNSPNSVLVFDASAPSNNLNSVTIDNPTPVTLSQTANTFLTNVEYVGYTNTGILSVSGGTHNIGNGGGTIYLGYTNGASGTFNLSAGFLQAADVFAGYAGNGTFNQFGGNHSLGGFLSLGGVPDGTGTAAIGTYNLVNGSLALNTLYVGLAGTGTFSQSNGSTSFGATDAGFLRSASGTVNLSGGSYFNVGDEIYGDAGIATLNSSGGSHLTASLTLGNQSGGAGVANITGGTITVDGIAKIGNIGSGTVNQSGGTLAPLDMYLATQPGSTGTYNLSNSAFLHITRQVINGQSFDGNEYMGYASTAVFNQTGGTHLVDVWLFVGRAAGSIGTYNMTGGTLSSPALSVGYLSTANNVFNQSSGSVSCKVFLTIGDQANCRGTYNFSGGTSILTVNTLYDSWAGLGTFNQTNGAAAFQQVYIAHESTAISTYNLFGGSVITTSSEDIGYHGKGTFNQTGGLHAVTGTAVVTIRTFTNATGAYNLSGGTFTAGVVLNNGSFNLTGGSANFASLSGAGTTTLAGATSLTVGALSQNRLSVSSGASVVINSAANPVTNSISQLSLTGGRLDIGNQNLVTLTGASTVRGYITGGSLFSSTVLAAGTNNLTIAYASSTDSVAPGVTVPAGSTLVKVTLPGDADLSGTVDFNDFLAIQNSFNKPGDWTQGDFDYNGVVDFNDFLILQNTYNHQLGGAPPSPAIAAIEAAIAVPEPAIPLALLALLPWTRSRRRANSR